MDSLKMQVAFVILFLGLLHHSQSAPLNCFPLLEPFAQILPQDLEGRWIFVAVGCNDTEDLERFKMTDSGAMNWIAINGTKMHFIRHNGFNDSCKSIASVITLEDNGFKFRKDKITVGFVKTTTCRDCLVMHFFTPDKQPWLVLLLSKRREVEGAEMDEFKTHVGCLRMAYVHVLGSIKELCDVGLQGNGTTTQEDPVRGGQTA